MNICRSILPPALCDNHFICEVFEFTPEFPIIQIHPQFLLTDITALFPTSREVIIHGFEEVVQLQLVGLHLRHVWNGLRYLLVMLMLMGMMQGLVMLVGCNVDGRVWALRRVCTTTATRGCCGKCRPMSGASRLVLRFQLQENSTHLVKKIAQFEHT